ncbi:MAG: ABC transporter ATP-binding protein [Alkalispirochaeta sp.]
MPTLRDQQFTQRFDYRIWIRLLRRAREFRGTVVVLAVVMLAVGATDALFPLLNGIAVDRYIQTGSLDGIGGLMIAYGALAVGQALLVWVLIVLAGRMETGLMYRFRQEGFTHLQHLSLGYFDRTPVGWLMSRLTSDVQRLGETVAWGLVDIVWGVAMMLAVAVAMVILNPGLALLVLTVVPPLALASYYFQKRILGAHRSVRRLNSEISAAFSEGIAGAVTSKTLVREAENVREFTDLTGRMRTAAIRAAVFSALYMPVVLLLGSVGTTIALMAGGARLESGTVTVGVIVAFVGYTVQFFEPVREVARVLTELQSAQSAAERIAGLLETEPEITDSPEVVARFGSILEPHRDAWPPCRGEVTFDHVSFHYHDGQPVLSDFNLTVAPGESIALVGETGSGKSTIVNLIGRFYEPVEGRVLIDGTDLRECSQSWIHSQLGYVLQTPQLFRGTVRDNIAFARSDATEHEVIEAARMVDAHEMITGLSGDYDHKLGEGGSGISTGQKQLISFARAVLADPRIFILDEATSSIDTETELRIQHAIRSMMRGRTSFIIAHRLSTVRHVDRILVLEQGHVIEEGSHDQLAAAGGRYSELHRESLR